MSPEYIDDADLWQCDGCGTLKTTEAKATACCPDESESGSETPDAPDAPGVELDTFPPGFIERDGWVPWSDWGRKQPNATDYSDLPRSRPDGDERPTAFSWSDPRNWTSFDHAARVAQADKREYAGIGFVLQKEGDPYDDDPDPFCVVDYDDARDPETGRVHPVVSEHIERAGSYADVSTSGTGVHIAMIGALREGVRTIDDALRDDPDFPDASIEVYDGRRFMAFTGRHIEGTPRDAREAQGFIDALADEFVTVSQSTPDDVAREPEKTRAELADVATTTEIGDVFDAIQHTDPSDVWLRSTVTDERGDGSKSLDPSWVSGSDSGRRLAQVGDGWVYRKGMIGLDALQVVALEERIITSETDYPSGRAFWRAVEALRGRGAHIPEYEDPESRRAGKALDEIEDRMNTETATDGGSESIDDPGTFAVEATQRALDALSESDGDLGKEAEAVKTFVKKIARASVAGARDDEIDKYAKKVAEADGRRKDHFMQRVSGACKELRAETGDGGLLPFDELIQSRLEEVRIVYSTDSHTKPVYKWILSDGTEFETTETKNGPTHFSWYHLRNAYHIGTENEGWASEPSEPRNESEPWMNFITPIVKERRVKRENIGPRTAAVISLRNDIMGARAVFDVEDVGFNNHYIDGDPDSEDADDRPTGVWIESEYIGDVCETHSISQRALYLELDARGHTVDWLNGVSKNETVEHDYGERELNCWVLSPEFAMPSVDEDEGEGVDEGDEPPGGGYPEFDERGAPTKRGERRRTFTTGGGL